MLMDCYPASRSDFVEKAKSYWRNIPKRAWLKSNLKVLPKSSKFRKTTATSGPGVTSAVEGVAGQAQQKAEQYAQQTQNLGHQISQSVQQVANNVDQATTAKVDQVSQRVDDLVSKVSQLQGEKADSLVQKAYSNTDVVQQGMASLRALNVLASRAGTTAKEFAKNFDLNNETIALAKKIVSSKISEQRRNEFVGRRISSIESGDDDNVENGEEEGKGDQVVEMDQMATMTKRG